MAALHRNSRCLMDGNRVDVTRLGPPKECGEQCAGYFWETWVKIYFYNCIDIYIYIIKIYIYNYIYIYILFPYIRMKVWNRSFGIGSCFINPCTLSGRVLLLRQSWIWKLTIWTYLGDLTHLFQLYLSNINLWYQSVTSASNNSSDRESSMNSWKRTIKSSIYWTTLHK